MRSSRLRFAVSLSLATLVGCGGGSRMDEERVHQPNHPATDQLCGKLAFLTLVWFTRHRSRSYSVAWLSRRGGTLSILRYFETVPYVLRRSPSFRNHRCSGQLIGQVIFGVWPGAVPERCARTRPGISVEWKLSFHRRVCGSRYGHSDRSEGQTSDRTLYRDHARGREYSQHFYPAYPIHYSR